MRNPRNATQVNSLFWNRQNAAHKTGRSSKDRPQAGRRPGQWHKATPVFQLVIENRWNIRAVLDILSVLAVFNPVVGMGKAENRTTGFSHVFKASPPRFPFITCKRIREHSKGVTPIFL
jgi:hypothetical protein